MAKTEEFILLSHLQQVQETLLLNSYQLDWLPGFSRSCVDSSEHQRVRKCGRLTAAMRRRSSSKQEPKQLSTQSYA